VDFPSSGGNLASADDWGGAVPLNQDVAFRKSGTYESTAVLADANDDLAEQGCARCAFFVPDDKRRLCLRVRPANSGIRVIVR
jgi:hypothetical protein